MISKIDIQTSSENQTIPLKIFQAYSGSKSALEIVNAPDLLGQWKIKAIKVVVIYPDNSEYMMFARKVKNSHVVSIPACDVVGKVKNGYRIIGLVEDESGSIQDDFILGVGDVAILSKGLDDEPEKNKHYLKLTDDISDPSIGDVSRFDGEYKVYDGVDWVGNERLPIVVKMFDSDVDDLDWNITIKGGEITLDAHSDSLNADSAKANDFTV